MKQNLLILVLVFLASCKKGEETSDNMVPVIEFASPTNNQTFSAGQTIAISATITDNTLVKDLHLEIINTTTGAFLTHEHYAANASSYTLSKTFVAQANATYKIKVQAEDDSRNIAKGEVTVISN